MVDKQMILDSLNDSGRNLMQLREFLSMGPSETELSLREIMIYDQSITALFSGLLATDEGNTFAVKAGTAKGDLPSLYDECKRLAESFKASIIREEWISPSDMEYLLDMHREMEIAVDTFGEPPGDIIDMFTRKSRRNPRRMRTNTRRWRY